MKRIRQRTFALLAAVVATAGLGSAEASAATSVISGKVSVASATSAPACASLDVIATVRQYAAGGESVLADHRVVSRATKARADGTRWSYRLEVESLGYGDGPQDVELSARCNSGSDPLVRHKVKVGSNAGWANPFPLPAGGTAVKRNFRVKTTVATAPPVDLAISPISTDAYGGAARTGASPCNASAPQMSMDDPNGTIVGYSNDAGSGCGVQTVVDGRAAFDVSRLAEWSDVIDWVELRYSESEIGWRAPGGGASTPSTCVDFVVDDVQSPVAWPSGRALADHRSSWDVTDIVEWWIDGETSDSAFALLSPEPAANDGSACMSQISNVELIIHFAQ
jgi:hypothetical protein